VERTLEFNGTRRYHYEAYFKKIGGQAIDPDTITGPDWQVRFAPEEMVSRGSFTIPRNKLTIIAEEERLCQLEAAFRLNFLTIGG
jgi:hypothetical protein